MPTGPGKYDDECTSVMRSTEARAVVLAIFNGKLGSGFSVQADPEILIELPAILRDIAREIESSWNQQEDSKKMI